MRKIDSNKTSGPDGVRLAIFQWWIHKSQLVQRVTELAEEVGPCGFVALHDVNVGTVLFDHIRAWDLFLKDFKADPTAVQIGAEVDIPRQEESFRTEVTTTLGAALKKTEWWRSNFPDIRKNKEHHSILKAVLES